MICGIMDMKIPHDKNPLKIVTISGGISGPDEGAGDEPWQDVVRRADCALYQAKSEGRNRVASRYYADLMRDQAPTRKSA
jgi:PleD family two-component response regulator